MSVQNTVAVALPGEPSAEARIAAIVHAYELEDDSRTGIVQNPSAKGFARWADVQDVRIQRRAAAT